MFLFAFEFFLNVFDSENVENFNRRNETESEKKSDHSSDSSDESNFCNL
jgi:hypothetical protein